MAVDLKEIIRNLLDFYDYDELFNKIKVQGGNSIKRIDRYKGKYDFTIPMSYGFVLI